MVRLNQEQSKYLAEILNNMGAIFFASMALPIFNSRLTNLDATDYKQLVLGFGYTIICWVIGFIILRDKEEV